MPHAHCGSITIEVLIACTVFTLSATAIVLTHAGAADAAYAAGIHTDFIALAESASHDVRQALATDFYASPSASTTIRNATSFEIDTSVRHISPCLAASEANVAADFRSYALHSHIAHTAESKRLGYDCVYAEHASWAVVHSDTYPHSDGGTAVDVSAGSIVVGSMEPPYLRLVENGTYVTPENDFTLHARVNALDAVLLPNGKHIVFAALATSTSQLAVIDITDTTAPMLLSTTTLRGVDPTGFKPEGWRLTYYDERVYASTLETAGPELHTFAVSPSGNVTELGTGTLVNITLNDFVVREELVGSARKKYLFAATSRDTGEIAVYDVTDSSGVGEVTEVTALRQNLPGAQDGESISVVGQYLYLGRASNTGGPELYVYDLTHMPHGMTLVGTAEIPSVSVTGIEVVGDHAFLAITPGVTNRRIDIWDVSNPSYMTRVYAYAYPGLQVHGIDYENDGVYGVSDRSPYLVRLSPYMP